MAPSSKLKVRKHREQLRRQGLRPLQIWVPDVLSRSFRTAAHKQSRAVAASTHADDDLAFIEAISDLNEGGSGKLGAAKSGRFPEARTMPENRARW